eukprot:sb/3472418/
MLSSDRLKDDGALIDNNTTDFKGIFATYPAKDTGTLNQLFDQIVGTAILLIVVCSVTTSKLAPGIAPIIVGLCVTSVGVSFGTNCGYPINPARDFAPRIATAMFGYDDTFSAGNYYFWVPVIGPIIGGVLGVFIHYLFIDIHKKDRDEEKYVEKKEEKNTVVESQP